MMTSEKLSGPGVRFPPPLLFVGGLFIAWLLDSRLYSMSLTSDIDTALLLRAIGYVLVLIGFVIAGWGMVTFARAKTAIIPNRPASTLVETGPYRFTRNPMYTGMTIAYVGGILILNSYWALIFLPFVLTMLYVFVVQREERYLVSEFGTSYEEYRGRVKRWI